MKKLCVILCMILLLTMQLTVFADGAPRAVVDARESVVRIVAETPFGTQFGTGFAVGAQQPIQYIVTNNHVIDGNQKVSVMLSRDNMIEATVLQSLPASDLAILRLTTPIGQVKPAVLNDKPAKEGTKGFALGYPIASSGLSETITGNKEDITITDGIISALQTVPYASGLQPVSVYQINAAVNPGNSGGPFVNNSGEVIGINSWGVNDADGINAAIRVEEITKVLEQLQIPYIKAQSLNLMWIFLVIAIILVLGAVVFLVLVLMKKNKQPKPTLYGLNGEFSGQRFYLPIEGVTIGRDAALCQIVLPLDSPKVSRAHCNLRYNADDQSFILTDLSSSNGTFLANGMKLQPKVATVLKDGTKFYIGDDTTVFRVGLEL